MGSLAIHAENLSKRYRIGSRVKYKALRDVIADSIKAPFRNLGSILNATGAGHCPGTATEEHFWALDDVSFQIERGETVGIIGKNGAGKSTLLKILSRITAPTRGEAEIRGRVGSLLEVGTGFHSELTGRENIFLNGAILGMRKKEIAARFEEIVAFAEVEKFLDTPVKFYSSGMYMRLAFAVAAHLDNEILLVDEVLAVGDAAFQKKCLGKMGDVSQKGRTVFFVSHNMAAIRQLTRRSLVIDGGRIIFDGPTLEAVDRYCSSAFPDPLPEMDVENQRRVHGGLSQKIKISRLGVETRAGLVAPEAPLVFNVTVKAASDVSNFRISMTIFRFDNAPVGSFFTEDYLAVEAGRRAQFRVSLSDHRLAAGKYYCGLAVGTGNHLEGHTDFDIVMEALHFEIAPPEGDSGTVSFWAPNWGSIRFLTPEVERMREQGFTSDIHGALAHVKK